MKISLALGNQPDFFWKPVDKLSNNVVLNADKDANADCLLYILIGLFTSIEYMPFSIEKNNKMEFHLHIVKAQQNNEKLNQITERIKQKYKPLRLFLYGSRASGKYRDDSDYDFVMVLKNFNSDDRHNMMSEIASAIRSELGVDVQVWVYSEAQFNDWKDEFSSIPETALNTGKEIDLGWFRANDSVMVY